MAGTVTFVTFPAQKLGASLQKKWGFHLMQGNSLLELEYNSQTEASRAFHTLAAQPNTHKVNRKVLKAIQQAVEKAKREATERRVPDRDE